MAAKVRYKKKAEREKEFVASILSLGGILNCSEVTRGKNTYYEFRLKNHTTRAWVNMSDENLNLLGVTK